MLEGTFIDKRVLVAWVRWRRAATGKVDPDELLEYIRNMPYYAVVSSEEVTNRPGVPHARSDDVSCK